MQPFDWILERIRPCGWPDEYHRRRSIIRTVAPIYLENNRSVTPDMISRFTVDTVGLSPVATGRKLRHLVESDLADEGIPAPST